MFSEPIRRAREEKAGRRGLCEELGQLFGVSKEPLAATSEGSLCTGPILYLLSHLGPRGSFRREVLASCPLVFAGDETGSESFSSLLRVTQLLRW